MFRFKCAVCLLLVGLLTSSSFGAAVKIRSFTGCGIAQDDDAMAMLVYAEGNDTTQIQLIAEINEVTTVRAVFTRSDGFSVSATFDTDLHGVTTVHFSVDGDWSDSNIILEDVVSSNIRFAVGQNPNNNTAMTCSQ